MISLFVSVFGFLQLTAAVKSVPLQPYGRKYFSVKTTNASIFSTMNRKEKFFSVGSHSWPPYSVSQWTHELN